MIFRLRTRLWLIGATCAVLIGLFGLHVGTWRFGWDSPMIRRAAGAIHVPAARVGSHRVKYIDYLERLDAEKRFLGSPAARAQGLSLTPDRETRERVLERAIRVAAVEEFAEQKGVIVTPLDVERAFQSLVDRAGTSTTPLEVRAFLMDQFGWDEQRFKIFVVRPAILEDTLTRKKLQETGDPAAFEKELQARLMQTDIKRYLTF